MHDCCAALGGWGQIVVSVLAIKAENARFLAGLEPEGNRNLATGRPWRRDGEDSDNPTQRPRTI